ncbi:c-type cytochrome [Mucilaginibacter sp. Bleaf8]|uniref:c-type cytochrome n=1 Tax=Mucilaginibacter sp. Bleaf8 TaxID=2834430 RepID=UPI001BCB5F69|nr:c-type cytochrome [Mucilaginibacter sp. Bleaf8]MBS7563259.1 c-type cytochrome [Mucilaginibacter sp. Bleaf8]
MKKTILLLSLTVFLAACGGSSDNKVSGDSTGAANQGAAARQSEAEHDTSLSTGAEKSGGVSSDSKGAQLIASSDCLSCHKEKEKLIGPAYADVAKKYSDKDIDMLADKIIKGGAGNWGDVPMTAHPSLAVNDAKEMAKYILTLK